MHPHTGHRRDRDQAARWLAMLLLATGAFAAAGVVALPLPESVDEAASALVGLGAGALGGVLWLARGWLRPAAIPWLVPLATATITLEVESWHGAAGDAAMLYVWVALYAAYFLKPWQAAVQLAGIGAGYAVVLARLDAGNSSITRWAVAMAVLVTAAVAMARLVRRQRESARERERLLELLRAAALTDELTGLPNRRSWDEHLDRETSRAGRSQGPLSVAILDLDRFKAYNDRHGHAAGDRLLKEAATAWSAHLRASDVLARYGGEEFVLLLPSCGELDALDLVERLRAATPPGQTVSAGVATWDGVEAGAELLERADGALYAAKAGGRDRVVVARAARAA